MHSKKQDTKPVQWGEGSGKEDGTFRMMMNLLYVTLTPYYYYYVVYCDYNTTPHHLACRSCPPVDIIQSLLNIAPHTIRRK
jgi:hypothetical protein